MVYVDCCTFCIYFFILPLISFFQLFFFFSLAAQRYYMQSARQKKPYGTLKGHRGAEEMYELLPRGPRGARGPELGSRGVEGVYTEGGIMTTSHSGLCSPGWGAVSHASLSNSNYSISNLSGRPRMKTSSLQT